MSEKYAADEAEREAFVLELQRLLACYQIASRDDRNVVWAAMNKYLPRISSMPPRAALPDAGAGK